MLKCIYSSPYFPSKLTDSDSDAEISCGEPSAISSRSSSSIATTSPSSHSIPQFIDIANEGSITSSYVLPKFSSPAQKNTIFSSSDELLLEGDLQNLTSGTNVNNLKELHSLEESKPLSPESKPLSFESKPLSSESKPLSPESRPLSPESKPLSSESKPIGSTSELSHKDSPQGSSFI